MFILENVTHVPNSDLTPGERESMPEFLVQGTYKGQPFKCKVAVELDGREYECESLEGPVFEDPSDPASEDFYNIFEPLWKHEEFKRIEKIFNGE